VWLSNKAAGSTDKVSHFRGGASGAALEKCCTRYGQRKRAEFSIHKYGNDEASVLYQAWCDKLSYYFAGHRESGKSDHVFDAEDHIAYIKPVQLGQLTERSTNENICNRAREIRDLKASHAASS